MEAKLAVTVLQASLLADTAEFPREAMVVKLVATALLDWAVAMEEDKAVGTEVQPVATEVV